MNLVLLQLDDACRHIADGRVAQLRLALLLLDNAAEIQMQRCANSNLWRELSKEKIRNIALSFPFAHRTKTMMDLIQWQPLDYKQKLNIERNFEDKVKYLCGRAAVLNADLAGPLNSLHRYRNEAYHSAKIRKETIDTAARLLLEINCLLLENLPRDITSYSSSDDYSWIKERFNCDAVEVIHNVAELIKIAVIEFRRTINHDCESVKRHLYNHIHSRVDDVHDALEFIMKNTIYDDLDTIIRKSFDLHLDGCKREGRSTKILEKSNDRHSLQYLAHLKSKLKIINGASDVLQCFHLFSKLESELEPVEQSVIRMAAEVDAMIQMEIDAARGK